jgi:hypothetical protein
LVKQKVGSDVFREKHKEKQEACANGAVTSRLRFSRQLIILLFLGFYLELVEVFVTRQKDRKIN